MDRPVRIAVLGDREPAFVSHRELDAALALLPAGVDAGWLPTPQARAVAGGAYDGVWVAPGGPFDDDGAVLAAIGHARRSGLPPLGARRGFQHTRAAAAPCRCWAPAAASSTRRWSWPARWPASTPATRRPSRGPPTRSSRRW